MFRRGVGVEDPNKLATILAFDPGEHTGWCALGAKPEALINTDLGALEDHIPYADYGEIDCGASNTTADEFYDQRMLGHASLNMIGENLGVNAMIDLAADRFLQAAMVLEDFIPDPKKFDQARHTLSPVRIVAAFSYGMSIGEEVPLYSRMFIQQRNAKSTATDARLRQSRLLDLHSGAHARDATRHAIYFLRDCRGGSLDARQKRWRAWPHLFAMPDELHRGRKPKRPRPVGERIEFLK